MSIILWDAQDPCGGLVPAQALLLHMTHIWVQTHGIAATFRYAGQASSSYLEEVDGILRAERRNVIRAQDRDDDTDFELRHLIAKFCNDIRDCMLAQQSAIRDGEGIVGFLSQGELLEFINRPPLEFSMKQDRCGPSDDNWRSLALEKNIPVLFCEGAGDVITTATSGFLCTTCKLPLNQECYLIASLACLEHMAQKYGEFRTQTKLTKDWGWQPTDEAALFEEHCRSSAVGGKCHERLQRLITLRDWQQGGNHSLPAAGAVVFGRPGSKVVGLAVAAAGQSSSGTSMARIGKLKKWARKMRSKS